MVQERLSLARGEFQREGELPGGEQEALPGLCVSPGSPSEGPEPDQNTDRNPDHSTRLNLTVRKVTTLKRR